MRIFVQLTTKLAMSCKQPPVECVLELFPQTQSKESVCVWLTA